MQDTHASWQAGWAPLEVDSYCTRNIYNVFDTHCDSVCLKMCRSSLACGRVQVGLWGNAAVAEHAQVLHN